MKRDTRNAIKKLIFLVVILLSIGITAYSALSDLVEEKPTTTTTTTTTTTLSPFDDRINDLRDGETRSVVDKGMNIETPAKVTTSRPVFEIEVGGRDIPEDDICIVTDGLPINYNFQASRITEFRPIIPIFNPSIIKWGYAVYNCKTFENITYIDPYITATHFSITNSSSSTDLGDLNINNSRVLTSHTVEGIENAFTGQPTPSLLDYYWKKGDLVFYWNGETELDLVGLKSGVINDALGGIYGVTGNAFIFDGNDDYINYGDLAYLNLDNYTISTWIKHTTLGVNQDPVTIQLQASSSGGRKKAGLYIHISDDNTVRCSAADTISDTFLPATYTTTKITDPNKWYNIVCTKDGTTGKIYIDGIADVTITYASNNIAYDDNSKKTIIGGAWVHATSDYVLDFDGIIDETSLFDRAFSDSEVWNLYNEQIYNHGDSCQDNRSDTTITPLTLDFTRYNSSQYYSIVYDNSTQSGFNSSNNMSCTKCPKVTTSGAFFDGVDDYFIITDTEQKELRLGYEDFTIETYMKTGSALTQYLLSKRNGGLLTEGWQATILNTGVPSLYIADGSTHSTNFDTGINIKDNKWHHLFYVGERNSSGIKLSVYVDGSFSDSDDTMGIGTISGTQDVLIGERVDITGNAFSGYIAYVEFKKYGESGELQYKHPLYSDNLIGYYTMNKNSSLNAYQIIDNSTYARHGNTTGAINCSVTGLKNLNNSCQFDGSSTITIYIPGQELTSIAYWYDDGTGWKHRVNSSGTIYINGVISDSYKNLTSYDGTTLTIGSGFIGKIDEIIISNTTINLANISLIYGRGYGGLPNNIHTLINESRDRRKDLYLESMNISSFINVTNYIVNITAYNITDKLETNISFNGGENWSTVTYNTISTWDETLSNMLKFKTWCGFGCMISNLTIYSATAPPVINLHYPLADNSTILYANGTSTFYADVNATNITGFSINVTRDGLQYYYNLSHLSGEASSYYIQNNVTLNESSWREGSYTIFLFANSTPEGFGLQTTYKVYNFSLKFVEVTPPPEGGGGTSGLTPSERIDALNDQSREEPPTDIPEDDTLRNLQELSGLNLVWLEDIGKLFVRNSPMFGISMILVLAFLLWTYSKRDERIRQYRESRAYKESKEEESRQRYEEKRRERRRRL